MRRLGLGAAATDDEGAGAVAFSAKPLVAAKPTSSKGNNGPDNGASRRTLVRPISELRGGLLIIIFGILQ